MSLYDQNIEAIKMSGETVDISSFKGEVLLIVNTASKCGFTPQFEGLEQLYKTYKDSGFLVLGFPCNQFKNQDPEDNEEIHSFCKINYGVTFPMFQKIEVNGSGRHELYKFLIEATNGKDVKWNFEKFLIARDGSVVKRYLSVKTPKSIEKDIVRQF